MALIAGPSRRVAKPQARRWLVFSRGNDHRAALIRKRHGMRTRQHVKSCIVTASSGILVLSAAACSDDTEAQKQIREQAEAIDQSYEAEADLEEALADGGPNEEAIDEYADALREKGERTEDQLKDAAKELGDVPQ
jgi:hypothetical protein